MSLRPFPGLICSGPVGALIGPFPRPVMETSLSQVHDEKDPCRGGYGESSAIPSWCGIPPSEASRIGHFSVSTSISFPSVMTVTLSSRSVL